ncbi:hypothetical protein [Actinoallomurus sp. NPDC052274]|uniref:hypothetical protein n=1 Tax=Actinoallomurus sp. NPDC052274 TaxID=3155420 RepID=UPI003413A8FE
MTADRLSETPDEALEVVAGQRDQRGTAPPDRPGDEDSPTRAQSRAGAAAANAEAGTREADAVTPDGQGNSDGPGESRADPVDPSSVIWLDMPLADDRQTPRELLRKFDPADAGLSAVSVAEAQTYLSQNADARPWLESAKDADPVVQRVLVAMDQGRGHALQRHEGFANDERLQRRVSALEDPAQLDAEKRAAGIDGCKPGNADHRCGNNATAIQDPVVFATAFVKGTEHPDVRKALDKPFESGVCPEKVSIPIADVLGRDGHRHCVGYQIEPVEGSLDAARANRADWVHSVRAGGNPSVPEPKSVPVNSFEGGLVEYFFRPNRARDGYEIATMYVEPPRP